MLTIDGVEMVDVREAAELVGRSPETVRRWAWTHRLDAVKHGNKLLFRRQDLLALVGAPVPTTSSHSLADWADRVRAVSGSGHPGSSSSDLVLADRAARGKAATDARG